MNKTVNTNIIIKIKKKSKKNKPTTLNINKSVVDTEKSNHTYYNKEMTEIKVFKLSNYNFNTKKNEEKNTVTLDHALSTINNKEDQNLHIKINPSLPCIAFGDIDYTTNETQIQTILEEISNDLNIPLSEFKLSHNQKEEYLTCHWSIPSYYTDIKTLKSIFSQDKYKSFIHIDANKKTHSQCDNNIYKSSPFRLPFQSANGKTIHKIIKGKAEDFIIHLIPTKSKKLIWVPEYKTLCSRDTLRFYKASKEGNGDTPHRTVVGGGIPKKCDTPFTINNKLNLDIMNEFYSIHFELGHFETFSDWFKLAYCGRHLNNTKEGYELFFKYSRLQKGYENEPEEHIKSHFYNGAYIEDFDEIVCLRNVRKLSKQKFYKFIDPLLKSSNILPSKHFNRRYIYPNETDGDYRDEIQKYNEFTDKLNPLKLMAISSPYGTGKTHTFKKLINNFDSVLF